MSWVEVDGAGWRLKRAWWRWVHGLVTPNTILITFKFNWSCSKIEETLTFGNNGKLGRTIYTFVYFYKRFDYNKFSLKRRLLPLLHSNDNPYVD